MSNTAHQPPTDGLNSQMNKCNPSRNTALATFDKLMVDVKQTFVLVQDSSLCTYIGQMRPSAIQRLNDIKVAIYV